MDESLRSDSGKLILPSDLMKNADLFRQVVSLDTWRDAFTDEERTTLKSFLPQLTDGSLDEDTIRFLFSDEAEQFGNHPLDQAWKTLHGAIVSSKQSVLEQRKRERNRQHQFQRKRNFVRLQRKLFVSRKKLALTDKTYSKLLPDCKGPHSNLLVKMNRKHRKLLMECREDIAVNISSFDEDSDAVATGSRSDRLYKRMLQKHKKRRIENIHLPELDTSDITLKSIVTRTDQKLLSVYADVVDRVDKEPPFDLHAYLAPHLPPAPPITDQPDAPSATGGTLTPATTSSTATPPTTNTATDKPKKEPSKPKLTNFTIQPSTDAEKKLYRLQEMERYENPHKAYTFNSRSVEATVGPVKGIYKKDQGNHSKVREHFLLKSSRPHYVTILSIVRDSASRLPDGGGTRADICMLVRDSQYIVEDATDAQVHAAVSGALDRLHYEKDPCVRYDSSKKVWVYLHRTRTRDEFEQIHLAGAHSSSTLKKSNQRQNARSSSAASTAAKTSSSTAQSKKSRSVKPALSNNNNTSGDKLEPIQQPSLGKVKELLLGKPLPQEPIPGSLLLDTSDIKLGGEASQPVINYRPVSAAQGLEDVLLSDSSKLGSSMMDVPNAALPPDAIFSSDDNSNSNSHGYSSDSS